ncbi:hypothetical protein MJG53_010926 [Ovis ammon polii x Ovis aries]|uniref:Uncharacterized protein n=1 Tax=Ovis ammon polii x Ovis aries TaxID=2918886 RepID=A0ACB9URY0_9CETA|nr:hypothetical protein MJG53_010926 [Ovis ammon polii x Ovis aries]
MCVSGAMRMEPGFSQNGADPAPVLSSPRSQSEKATNQVPGLLDQCLTRLLSGLLIDSGFFLQVTSQRAGWRMLIFLLMCLLPAASALTGPRLVSGESGGAVTIRCRYPRSAINSHQRKYWCRLRPSTGVCRTIVSTNHYTHLRYRGRVALADFPKRGLFVVRLSQLTPEDEGRYRCGLGSSNNALFLSMNLTVSPEQYVEDRTGSSGSRIENIASLEEKNFCGILTPVSSVLCPLMLVTLVLWKRKLQRKKSSQKTGRSSGVTLIQMTQSPELGLQPGQPPQVGRKRLQVDPPPLHTSLSLPARDPGPQGMEG